MTSGMVNNIIIRPAGLRGYFVMGYGVEYLTPRLFSFYINW